MSRSTETSMGTRKYSARSGRTAKLYNSRTHRRSTPRVASRANAVYAYRSASTIIPAFSGGTILYSSRSAKSVACSRLNVIGVSAFFFLPVFVAALTSADEFHSVMKTGWPAALSHFASSASCVVFPDPSIPSTTNSFPGYACGVVWLLSIRCLFLVVGARDLEPDRPFEDRFERRGVAGGGPPPPPPRRR